MKRKGPVVFLTVIGMFSLDWGGRLEGPALVRSTTGFKCFVVVAKLPPSVGPVS